MMLVTNVYLDVGLTYDVHRIGKCVVEARDSYTAHVHGHEYNTSQEVNKSRISAVPLQNSIEY